jgi:hypothetical protein
MKVLQRIILLFVLLFSISNMFSQSITFKKVYPGFSCDPYRFRLSCKPYNNDKSFIISAGELFKINSAGSLIFVSDFIGLGGELSDFIVNDSIITLYGSGAYTKYFSQLDTSFNFIFTKEYGDNISCAGSAITDRNIFLHTSNDGFLLSAAKGRIDTLMFFGTNSFGTVIWAKYFMPVQGGIQDIIQTQDSGFIIAANLKNLGASLIKTDSVGNVLWSKSYIRPRGYIHNVLENPDGSLIITGNMDSLHSGTLISPHFFVKIDIYGNVIWAKTFGDDNNI